LALLLSSEADNPTRFLCLPEQPPTNLAYPSTACWPALQEHEEAELFNPGWLEDEESVVAEAMASCVSPLAAQPGRVVLTQQRIYFQPFNLASGAPIQAYQLGRVVAVAPRVYQLEDLGLEVFFSSRHSLYLAFRLHADRARMQRLLMQQPALQLEKMRSREQWTRDWVNGRIRWGRQQQGGSTSLQIKMQFVAAGWLVEELSLVF
jgi:hypothetical protein